jgi:hypothetical protein
LPSPPRWGVNASGFPRSNLTARALEIPASNPSPGCYTGAMQVPTLDRNSARLLVAVALLAPPATHADFVALNPVADTSLISAAPANNNGGEAWMLAGVTQNYTTNRGLFRFDLTAVIPPGALIESADVILDVTRQPRDGYAPAPFGLYHVLQPWGEGNKVATDNNGGLGAPADPGEAAWDFRFAFAQPWGVPGGAADIDYAGVASSQTFIYGIGDSPYTFQSTPELTADVQGWLDNPASNFGWMLVCQDESQNFTARRFGSREDPGAAPQLLVQFTIVPEPSSALLGLVGLAALTGARWGRKTRRHGAGKGGARIQSCPPLPASLQSPAPELEVV